MPCDSSYIMLFYPFNRSPKKVKWCFFLKKKTKSFDSTASTVIARHDK